MAINWNNTSRTLVIGALKAIPKVGSIIGALVDVLWPVTKVNIWDQIEEQVEALMDEKINSVVYQLVQNSLNGLQGNLLLYTQALNGNNPPNISTQWIITQNFFVNSLPDFQSPGSEVLLLPLFGQFANLHLGLLRDGVISGASWGWNQTEQQQAIDNLKTAIDDYTVYSDKIYAIGCLEKSTANFSVLNSFVRQITLTVLDFKALWPYFDVTLYPNGASIYLDREIYTDPFGNPHGTGLNTNSGLWVKAYQPLTGIRLERFNANYAIGIGAIILDYPQGGGPNGSNSFFQGSYKSQYDGSIDLTNNSVVAIQVFSHDLFVGLVPMGTALYSFTFFLDDGTSVTLGQPGQYSDNNVLWQFDGEIISSISFYGVPIQYWPTWGNNGDFASQVVFGFKFPQNSSLSTDVLHSLYITHPSPISVEEFIASFPNETLELSDLSNSWKLQRDEYWNNFEHRVVELNI